MKDWRTPGIVAGLMLMAGCDTGQRTTPDVLLRTETYRLTPGDCVELVDAVFWMQSVERPYQYAGEFGTAERETWSYCGGQALDGVATICADEDEEMVVMAWYEVVRPDLLTPP